MKKKAPEVVTSELPAAAPLAMSDAAVRLRGVVEEHDKLLALVARRQKELERVEQEIHAAVARVASHMAPLVEEAQRLDEAIHSMMEALAAAKRRPQRERSQIRRVYRDLQKAGVISSRETSGADDASGFGMPPEHDRHCTCHDDEGRFAAPDLAVVKETERGAVRELFRSLVELLHPDKVQDEEEKATRTEVMKEVTVAYRERDFARLLEIERAWAASTPVAAGDRTDQVEQRIALLTQSNLELRKQMRALERRLRRMRNSEHGRLSRDLKRSDRAGDGLASVVGPLEEELQDLRRVHDFIQAFQNGQISLAEFLEGPADEDEEIDEAVIFEALLGELVTLMHEEVGPGRAGRSGRGKRARDKNAKPKRKRRRA